MAESRWKSLETFRDYEKNLTHCNKISLDIGFLKKCKLFQFFPKFLNFKLSRPEFHDTRACRRFKEDLLSYELKQKCFARRNYEESYESARSRLKAILFPLDFSHVSSTIEAKASKFKDLISFTVLLNLKRSLITWNKYMKYRRC